MNDYTFLFDSMEWEKVGVGARKKTFSQGKLNVKLLRFDDDFVEEDWCTKGHLGYVLSGEMKINFNGQFIDYKPGDGLSILSGLEQKHKAVISEGKFVEILLFEVLEQDSLG